MNKTKQYLESIGCPIRKWTEEMFISIKGRWEKYWWNNVTLSKLSHKRFWIWRSQADKIIKDFRAYWILQWETTKKKLWEINKPNRYNVPQTIIKFFKRLNTVFKWIVNMNEKIFNKNQTITKEWIIKFIKRFNIWLPIVEEQEWNIDYWAKALIKVEWDTVYEDKWYNAFDYIKERTKLSKIEIANYYLRA